MHKYILVLIMTLSFCGSYGQSTFEYFYSTGYNELSRSIIEDVEGNVYFPVENFEFGLIIKLDPEGIFADSIRILNPSGTCNISELIPKDSGLFIALGHWSTDTTNELWYLVLDNNLQIVDDKNIFSENNIIYDFKYIINHKGNIVFTALYQPNMTDLFQVCIWELTLQGDVVRNRFFDQGNGYNTNFSILEYSGVSTYIVFTRFNLHNRLSCFVNNLDSNFNLIDNPYYFGHIIGSHNTAKWINDSTYLLTGEKVDFNTGDYNLGILKVNVNDSISDIQEIGSPDTIDWPGLYKNLDWLSFDNIFYAGTINSYWFPFQNGPSWIILNILDTGLNIKSQQYYGGDAYYLVNALLATQDSGCLMACTRYDWTKPDNEFDVYILKVNKDGLLTSSGENRSIPINEIIISPNPAWSQVTVRYPDIFNHREREIIIWNTLGTAVRRLYRPPGQAEEPVEVSNLPPGLYIAVLYANGEKIAVGKFVVK